MNKKRNLLFLILTAISLDILFIIIADLASFIIRFNGQFPEINFQSYLRLALFIIILRLLSFYIFRLYDKPKYKSNFEILINTTKACTTSSIIIITFLYFLNIVAYPRSIAIISWFLTIIFISTWRFVVKEFVGLYLGKDFLRAHLLVLGTGKLALETSIHALGDAAVDYKLLGFLNTDGNKPIEVEKEKILGALEDLPYLIKEYVIDEVVIADPDLTEQKISKIMNLLSGKKIVLKSASPAYEAVIADMVLSKNIVPFVGPTIVIKPATWYWGLKRILDIISSIIILGLSAPILLLAVILIKVTSGGPIFYLQKRTGLNGASFVIYKLRTMYMDAEKGKRPRWAKRDDVRITPLGKILRRFRIDELPQLINVLRNEMSLIGPRPERPYFMSKLMKKIPFYAERLQVKPGITGWAQVNFKYAASEEDTEKKLIYDLFYIQNMSFALDLLIALKTLNVVITCRGAQ